MFLFVRLFGICGYLARNSGSFSEKEGTGSLEYLTSNLSATSQIPLIA